MEDFDPTDISKGLDFMRIMVSMSLEFNINQWTQHMPRNNVVLGKIEGPVTGIPSIIRIIITACNKRAKRFKPLYISSINQKLEFDLPRKHEVEH